ncbi:hypothetical protein ARALYDRAFT_491323, partial [Arabidopsis lyrata subsp. lyrata]
IIQGLDVAAEGGGEKNGMDGRLVGREGMDGRLVGREGIVVGNEGKVGTGGIPVGIVGRFGCGKADGNGNGDIAVGIVGRVGKDGCGNVDGNGGSPIVGIGRFGICWRRRRDAEHVLIIIEEERLTKKAMRKSLYDAIDLGVLMNL